tara:strand:- start:10492 stop:10725 length:234 start_codon:yes stop_codon:yes gene_type:complete
MRCFIIHFFGDGKYGRPFGPKNPFTEAYVFSAFSRDHAIEKYEQKKGRTYGQADNSYNGRHDIEEVDRKDVIKGAEL